MKNGQECKHCKHYDREGAPRPTTGFCRRFPPTAHPLLVPAEHPITRQQVLQNQTHTVWPIVEQSMHCGEYTLGIALAS